MGRPCKHYIGETFTANNGMKFTIINIDRTSKKPFTIQFEDGYITNTSVTYLKNGAIIKNSNLDTKTNRLGEQRRHKDGSLMTIIEYNDCNNILVKFDDSSISRCKYYSFVNGTCIHKIMLFGEYYKSMESVCKHFNISKNTIAGKSSTEIEEYITNNRIEYNGQWVSITNYLKAHGIITVNFYEYLRVNDIEKNTVNIKRYTANYLETVKNKIDATTQIGDILKIINNYFETSFKSLNAAINYLGLGANTLYKYTSTKEELIKYIKQHAIRYEDQWISIKSYCEKLGIEYNSLKAWAKMKSISINSNNITDALKSYRNSINLESKRTYEMQKLEHLRKKYFISDARNIPTHNIYTYFNNNNISAEQVIVHFRPDLHINIFGKIVDENGNEV